MEAQISSVDIGLVSLEWLQSDDSFSFEAFGDIDELMANLPDFAATPPCSSDVDATPSHPSTTFGTALPRPSVFATTDGDELQRLQDKNKNKNTKKIHKYMGELSPEMAGTQGNYRNITGVKRAAA